MRQVTITGGAGFIGANLSNYFLSHGWRVVVFDNLERKGCSANLEWLALHPNAQNLEVLMGDIRLPSRELQEAIEGSVALCHMAGQVAVTTSVQDPGHDFQVNAFGTFRLLELVRNSQQMKPVFFYASTNKVYGGMEDLRIVEHADRFAYHDLPHGIREDRLLDFHSPYGCSKGAADQYVRDYARIYDLQTVVFRQSCIYGSRQFGLEDQGWVAWFVIAAVLGLPMTIYGNGKQVRDILFIDDLIDAYAVALNRIDVVAGKIFNLGGGPSNAISLHDLITMLKTEVTPSLDISYADWRPGDQPIYVSDISKARDTFDWEPAVDWRTGVEKLIRWVSDNRSMLERILLHRAPSLVASAS